MDALQWRLQKLGASGPRVPRPWTAGNPAALTYVGSVHRTEAAATAFCEQNRPTTAQEQRGYAAVATLMELTDLELPRELVAIGCRIVHALHHSLQCVAAYCIMQLSICRVESPSSRLERVLREADAHIMRTRQSGHAAQPGAQAAPATRCPSPTTQPQQLEHGHMHADWHTGAAGWTHRAPQDVARGHSQIWHQPASGEQQVPRPTSAASATQTSVTCMPPASGGLRNDHPAPAVTQKPQDGFAERLSPALAGQIRGCQSGQLVRRSTDAAGTRPSTRSKGRRGSALFATPPNEVDEQQLRQARVDYREQVMRIMHQKREELAREGYLP
jgi:hypothetical protein